MWPETYCMTLDESWSAGVPVLATPIGAPAERIKAYGGGILAKECSSTAILEEIKNLLNHEELLPKITSEVKDIPLISFSDSAAQYYELYNKKIISSRDLNSLKSYIVTKKKRKTVKEIIKDYVKFKVMFILDYFGIKAKVKAFMTKYSLLDYLR